jgi:hypothetical protein
MKLGSFFFTFTTGSKKTFQSRLHFAYKWQIDRKVGISWCTLLMFVVFVVPSANAPILPNAKMNHFVTGSCPLVLGNLPRLLPLCDDAQCTFWCRYDFHDINQQSITSQIANCRTENREKNGGPPFLGAFCLPSLSSVKVANRKSFILWNTYNTINNNAPIS